MMIVILLIGMIVDGVLFGFAERMVRIRYGLARREPVSAPA